MTHSLVTLYGKYLCVTSVKHTQSGGTKGGLPTQTTGCPWSEEVYMEEAVPTCSMAPGQHPPHSAQPIIWHLVLLDRDLCGNSMFLQRLLICVMSVVWKGKTLISLWSPSCTLYGAGARLLWVGNVSNYGRKKKTCSCFGCLFFFNVSQWCGED